MAIIGLLVAAALPSTPGVVAQEGVTAGFPASLGGQPLEVQTFTGPEWLARVDPASEDGARVTERTQALVTAGGGSIDDLAVATALHEPSPGNHAAITAVRMSGAAAAADLVMPAIGLLLGDISQPSLRLRSVGGRDILRVTDAAVPGTYPRTVYAAGDTVWVVEAEGEPLAEIIAALPPRQGPPAPDTSALAGDFPSRLAGERPSELYMATGWGGPISPALGAMFGPESEEVAVRLFLEHGVTLEDLTWAYGIWSGADDAATVLAAFRIAGLDPATMQGVLEGVIVPSFSGGFQQPAQATSEVSGRTVVTLRDDALPEEDRAAETYHFVIGGDTIWMVNAPAADQAMIAEAIGALPA